MPTAAGFGLHDLSRWRRLNLGFVWICNTTRPPSKFMKKTPFKWKVFFFFLLFSMVIHHQTTVQVFKVFVFFVYFVPWWIIMNNTTIWDNMFGTFFQAFDTNPSDFIGWTNPRAASCGRKKKQRFVAMVPAATVNPRCRGMFVEWEFGFGMFRATQRAFSSKWWVIFDTLYIDFYVVS